MNWAPNVDLIMPLVYWVAGFACVMGGVVLAVWWQRWVVCVSFHGPAPQKGMHAAHQNSIRTDNRSSNLKWKTPKENEADKILLGRTNRGERNGRAKLTAIQVAEIRASVDSSQILGGKYGVAQCTIIAIRKGRNWL